MMHIEFIASADSQLQSLVGLFHNIVLQSKHTLLQNTRTFQFSITLKWYDDMYNVHNFKWSYTTYNNNYVLQL